MGTMVHPNPQFERKRWTSLDGPWSFAFSTATSEHDVAWRGTIEVPYAPEAPLSGVEEGGYHPVAWYRRTFAVPEAWADGRVVLHLGAVDYAARVFLNGSLVVSHEGGHTPFEADVTDVLVDGEQVLVVRAEDDPHDVAKPRGKQDWRAEPHAIWYPRTTGIWQSVWLEAVPATHVAAVRMIPDMAAFAIRLEVDLAGDLARGLAGARLDVRFTLGERELASDGWTVPASESGSLSLSVARTVHLNRPTMDDVSALLWSPEHPNVIDVHLALVGDRGVLDEIATYTALRSVRTEAGAFLLNERPYRLRLALDQGYWDDGLLTPPSDDALRHDVELAKALGFNGVRKHQKVEQPRYLYWADRLGLLVWEEMPSAYIFGGRTVERLTREWLEVLRRDGNHPCIVAWVCFNESWGVPLLAASREQRHAVAALYHLTRSLDGTRLVVGNDGWEHVATDLLTVHDYAADPATLRRRFGTREAAQASVAGRLDHGRLTVLPHARLDAAPASEPAADGPPIVLSEFGGVRFHPGADGWGYQQVEDEASFVALYRELVAAASAPGLAGFCYTQFADTFQEQNGLLFSDRRPKAPLEALSAATRGGG